MSEIDATEYQRYLSCGGYGWDYNEQWRAELRFLWDFSVTGQFYELFLYPLPNKEWKLRKHVGTIKAMPLGEMLSVSENEINEYLNA